MNATATALKETIKGLVDRKVELTMSRVEHKQAPPEEKQTREYVDWFGPVDGERSHLKYEIRHHLLAYALVRRRPYRTVERRCGEDNCPSASSIRRVLRDHDHGVDLDVEGWLSGESSGESSEEVAA